MSTVTTRVSDKRVGEGVAELSARSESGIDVALLWQQRDNTAAVVVVDHGNGETFLLDVRENDNALDMFHHPYAYAALRCVDHEWPAPGQDLWIAT